jgi:hypothetical protein
MPRQQVILTFVRGFLQTGTNEQKYSYMPLIIKGAFSNFT